jgi:hypothetical protein
MTCFADTSFLLSVAGDDANTPKATAWLAAHPERICVTALVLFECVNRLHKWHLDGTLDDDEHRRALEWWDMTLRSDKGAAEVFEIITRREQGR